MQNTYSGKGGVPIGSTLRRLAYAIKYREANFLLSDAVNGASRILDHRTPTERVERVAPWLRLDGNVYPAVVEGRVQWIVDGFTTSASYPQPTHRAGRGHVRLGGPALQRRHRRRRPGQLRAQRRQGHRRRLHRRGEALRVGHHRPDAQGVEQRLSRVRTEAVRDLRRPDGPHPLPAGLPQGAARAAHRDHVTNPGDFFSGSDKWRVPRDPSAAAQDQPPVFQSIAMPGENEAASRSPRRSSRRRPTARAGGRSCVACWPSTPTPATRPASPRPTTACCACWSTAPRHRPGRGRSSTRSRTPRSAPRTRPSSCRWRRTSPRTPVAARR